MNAHDFYLILVGFVFGGVCGQLLQRIWTDVRQSRNPDQVAASVEKVDMGAVWLSLRYKRRGKLLIVCRPVRVGVDFEFTMPIRPPTSSSSA